MRGIACLLLVAYHVIGNDSSGLRLPAGSVYRTVNDALAYVRMPLFTFLSGLVYALRPLSMDSVATFLEGKAKRLLIPFVCVGLLFTVVQCMVPGANSRLPWEVIPATLIWPNAHFWFLPALFLIFMLTVALESYGLLSRPLGALAVFAASCFFFQFHNGAVGVFSWNRALYLLPFFLAGIIAKRFDVRWTAALLLIALLAPFWQIKIGVVASAALLALTPKVRPLARIGLYSYTIYLFHVFGTAGARIVLQDVGISSTLVMFLLGTAAGIALPIALHRALQNVPYLNRAFLGLRSNKNSIRMPATEIIQQP
ncbi:acyltransferase [Sphingomonas piscis]|uniref:Acyltransferase n=1 Tax=Sphingomonas piscis TaxID=2714943 RepID=A0A6G7YQS1_9SPHN|nr:acyltransferase [Sphingomonas piscis]QIK79090.1 acyltransferase [Sphingomonas piscis]